MLEGILILWTVLTILSLVFVIYDLITVTPEAGIMKVAWALVVLYTGPIGLFLYFLTCREHLPGTHEKFIEPTWKQALGSEVHCLAGDATGIIGIAILLSFTTVPRAVESLLEYVGGFAFGLFIFQALFMKKAMGGTYIKAIKNTFFPEWISMNYIMAGMLPIIAIWGAHDRLARDPSSLHFWGMISFATLVAGIVAYPANYWLVKNKLKHGMMTVRKDEMHETEMKHEHSDPLVPQSAVKRALLLSLLFLAIGIIIAVIGSYI